MLHNLGGIGFEGVLLSEGKRAGTVETSLLKGSYNISHTLGARAEAVIW